MSLTEPIVEGAYDICWHCHDCVALATRPRCEHCPDECDIEGCDAPGCRDDWDDTTDVDLRVQHLVGPYPTLHAIGLGPQLAELERICADAAKGKHSGGSILEPGSEHHWIKAANHLTRDGTLDSRDSETNARHLIHAAARLLMAAACLDADDAAVKQSLTAAARLDAEGET